MLTILIKFLIPISIVIATIILAYLVNRIARKLISRAAEDLDNDPTSYKFLRHLIIGLIYLIGFGLAIYTIPKLRTVAHSMFAGAGIFAVAIGFASQHALSNIVSGIFIVIFKPFKINDRLGIRTFQGVVEDITLRHTVIRDFENKRIIIPNALISNEVLINADFAEESICKWVEINIAYDSDIDLAKSIICDEIANHPFSVDVRKEEDILEGVPLVISRVIGLKDSSILIRGWAWAKDVPNGYVMYCDLLESIKKRFDKEGISIPFPQQTVYLHNDKTDS